MQVSRLLVWIETSQLATAVRDSTTITGLLSAVHLVGMSVIVGAAIIAGLRAVGLAFADRPLADIARAARFNLRIGLAVSVSTGLLHGAQPAALVICHDPVRKHMRGLPHYRLPGLAETIEANIRVAQLTSPDVKAVGIALNTSEMPEAEARALCARTAAEFGLPCTDPYRFGVDAILDELLGVPASTGSAVTA